MMPAARRDWLSIGITAVVALAWIASLAFGPELGVSTYFFPLLVLAACSVIAIVIRVMPRQTRITAFLFMFVLFALNLNFRERELGVTGLDWQNGMKFATWSAILALAWMRRHRIASYFQEPLLSLTFSYACLALASAGWSETPTYSAASAIGLFAYLALACIVVEELGQGLTLRLMVWTLAAYVAAGLAGTLAAPAIAWLPPSVEETTYRLQGFSGHPNVFGQQIGIFITVTAIAWRLNLLGRFPALALLAIGTAALLATGSRTTLAAVLLAWGIVALRDRRRIPLAVLSGMGLAAAILIGSAIGGLSNLDEHLAGLSRTGTAGEVFTLTGRTEIWGAVWSLIQEKPLFGWGYNGTEDLISSSMSVSFLGTAVNAHNMILQSFVSIGFLGSLPALAFIALLVVRFFTAPDSGRDQFMAFMFIVGLGEVGIVASPGLLTLSVFIFMARAAERTANANAFGSVGIRWPMHPA